MGGSDFTDTRIIWGDGLRFFVNADKIYCIRHENTEGGATDIPVIFV